MEFNEKENLTTENPEEETEYAYKNVIPDKQHRRTWSVASLVLGILSVLCSYFSWFGLILGLVSAGASLVSRKNLGYFDKLSLTALIIAIFGVVFSLTGIIFAGVFESLIG